jgi:hypothetical protein
MILCNLVIILFAVRGICKHSTHETHFYRLDYFRRTLWYYLQRFYLFVSFSFPNMINDTVTYTCEFFNKAKGNGFYNVQISLLAHDVFSPAHFAKIHDLPDWTVKACEINNKRAVFDSMRCYSFHINYHDIIFPTS